MLILVTGPPGITTRMNSMVGLAMIAPSSVGATLPPRRPGHHEIDLAATALRPDEPLAPIENVSGSHLRGVGLDLMLAGFARDDQADLGRGGSAQRHCRAAVGLHYEINSCSILKVSQNSCLVIATAQCRI